MMSQDLRFTVKYLESGTHIVYVLQIRKSTTAAITQKWLSKKGIDVVFQLRGWWYEASWEDSPQAQAIAPLLQARAEQP